MKVIVISFQSLTADGAGGTGRLAFAIASKLHQMQVEVKLIVSSKGKFDTDFLSSPVHRWSRYYLWLINKVHCRGLISLHLKRYLEEVLFDRFCRSQIGKDTDLIISTNCHIPNTLNYCSNLGLRTVLIPGNPSDTQIFRTLCDEMSKWRVRTIDPYTFPARLRSYKRSVGQASTILCHSSVIHNTFKDDFPEKAIAACFGVIHTPAIENPATATSSRDETFIVLYVGYTVLLKGLQYLLKAWLEFNGRNAELWIVGSIDRSVRHIMDRDFGNLVGVKCFGVKHDMEYFYNRSSLMVVPSLLDGGPVTPLEAMNYGVPVVITTGCGVRDIITSGKDGFIVNPGDYKEILEVMKHCYGHREDVAQIGRDGASTLAQQDFDRFISRLTLTAVSKLT